MIGSLLLLSSGSSAIDVVNIAIRGKKLIKQGMNQSFLLNGLLWSFTNQYNAGSLLILVLLLQT